MTRVYPTVTRAESGRVTGRVVVFCSGQTRVRARVTYPQGRVNAGRVNSGRVDVFCSGKHRSKSGHTRVKLGRVNSGRVDVFARVNTGHTRVKVNSGRIKLYFLGRFSFYFKNVLFFHFCQL